MKHIKLEYHNNRCYHLQNSDYMQHFCGCTDFLIHYNNKFCLITYNNCLNSGGHLDFKLTLLKEAFRNSKISLYPTKSTVIDDVFKSVRRKNFKLEHSIDQVHYLYNDMTQKWYGITSKTNFIDSLVNQKDLDENYNKACSYIKDYDGSDSYLLEDLNMLYQVNSIPEIPKKEVFNTINSLTREIRKEIRQYENN